MEKYPQTISNCFIKAFQDHGVTVSGDFIKANRGRDKKEVISEALSMFHHPLSLVESVTASLKMQIENNLDNFYENNGAGEIIEYLRQKNIAVGLGSGFPRDVFDKILHHLKWERERFDYIGIAEEIGKGRPHPDMILDMLHKCGLRNDEMLKVGDTVADIQEGKNAKVYTAAILSGTQDEKDIREQQPDFTIRTLGELKEII